MTSFSRYCSHSTYLEAIARKVQKINLSSFLYIYQKCSYINHLSRDWEFCVFWKPCFGVFLFFFFHSSGKQGQKRAIVSFPCLALFVCTDFGVWTLFPGCICKSILKSRIHMWVFAQWIISRALSKSWTSSVQEGLESICTGESRREKKGWKCALWACSKDVEASHCVSKFT